MIPLVVAAHGTRSPDGPRTVRAVLAAVRAARPGLPVHEAYLDVIAPTFADVVAAVGGPAVVVPFLLSGGYHVRSDIPSVLAGRTDVTVTPPLGPDGVLTDVLADRLAEARGRRPAAEEVVLAWAGSSDPAAVADAARAADLVADRLGRPVRPAALSGPDRATTVPAGAEVATYLLAPGEFADRAVALGAAVTAAPLGDHPTLAGLVLARYDRAAYR